MIARAFAPGSIGNVGPGFDVLGLAVDGIGDTVELELTDGEARITTVTGRDAEFVPREAIRNAASIAAIAWLRAHGDSRNPVLSINKGLPLAGGLGGSAASAVAGAYAARLAVRGEISESSGAPRMDVIAAALAGESAVAGKHLDNIAASALGGLTLSLSVEPIDAISLPVSAAWWVALVTPDIRIETRAARSILPMEWPREKWVKQMANTAALVHAFASSDGDLLSRALDDLYAEPQRAALIPHFREIKRAALRGGAFGCSISGSGPTIFAIANDEAVARSCASAMQEACGEMKSTTHVGSIANQGVRQVSSLD